MDGLSLLCEQNIDGLMYSLSIYPFFLYNINSQIGDQHAKRIAFLKIKMPGPYGQSRNPFGNHAGTKHRPDKQTGGANRGQGNISNEERERQRVVAFTLPYVCC